MKKYQSFRLGKNFVSLLLNKKAAIVITTLAVLTVIVLLTSVCIGEVMLNPFQVFRALLGYGEKMDLLVVQSFRMPRILIALLAGICLASAGGILQGLIRNPLASPDIIGFTSGASTAIVGFFALFSDKSNSLTISIHWLPVAAFAGATLIGLIVYFLSWKKGASSFRLVLIGIGMSMLAQSVTTLLMIQGPIYRASEANVWITGSVYGATWEQVRILAPITLVFVLISIVSSRSINILELGDEIATGVGSNVQKNRFLLLLLSTALTGSAVAFAGGIGFVGLIAPHIARRLVGSSFGALLPVAAFIGGLLVMLADLIGRTLFAPLEVPAGVFTAAIGAPYFIYLLYKTRSF
ncbi:iron chelate uptake ABC transporter family permease subunit [Bacillus sp. V2I10]|uniref:FecCD family ABC transporter permease n=1 Tax=Bacillus sp. V2I10 TaxID=3042276 RepID=UPI0027826A48|nr:iron ABC transporter permease [Bacillus sp. V2I10]MDQ0861854.1 iron complex transport system permease protein [Bacillus sp. V2I10]